MRAKLLHPATFIAMLALLVALEVPSTAARLIDGKELRKGSVSGAKLKNGTVKKRKLARGLRAKLNAKGRPGPAGPAGPAGPTGATGSRGPAGAALTCPAGTALHELACIEVTARAQADWYDAFDACDQAQRRLVTLGELQTFRFRADLGAPTAGSEWADGALSDDGGSTRKATYLTMNLGIPDLTAITAVFPYRCVVPATVG
jgi:hypothetical protein